MLDAARRLQGYASGKSQHDVEGDSLLRAAVERVLEIVGVAASRVSDEFRDAHPTIPWRRIIALRNVIAHQYDDIVFDRIWAVVTRDVPELIQLLEPLMPAPPEEPRE